MATGTQSEFQQYRIEWDDQRVDLRSDVQPVTVKVRSWIDLEAAIASEAKRWIQEWRQDQTVEANIVRSPSGDLMGYVSVGLNIVAHFSGRKV